MKTFFTTWLGMAVLCLGGASTRADDVADQPRRYVLRLTPAAEPTPALKYRLLPQLLDRRPGNAAIQYNKAALMANGKAMDDLQLKLSDWLDLPADKLPLKDMQAALQWEHLFTQLDLAARRESCDWELPIREQNTYAILLPEMEQSRRFSRLLVCKARLEIAQRQFDSALHTLQTGFSMARHVGEGGTLIHGLVGLAIAQQMTIALQDWSQQPGSPSMYWAITALPQPYIDFRLAIETESSMLQLSFPLLRNLEDKQFSQQDGLALLAKMQHDFQMLGLGGGWSNRLGITALAIKAYPEAKRRLIAQGRTTEQVSEMPVMQVVMLDAMRTYDEERDKMFRWFHLPYPQAGPALDRALKQFDTGVRKRETFPLASMLLPALNSAYFAKVRMDRQFAALRVVEAVRMYQAAHDGRLPERLSDIEEAPLPPDPVTGQAFDYRFKDGVGNLSASQSDFKPVGDQGLRYELHGKP